jgi:hypothetical protein
MCAKIKARDVGDSNTTITELVSVRRIDYKIRKTRSVRRGMFALGTTRNIDLVAKSCGKQKQEKEREERFRSSHRRPTCHGNRVHVTIMDIEISVLPETSANGKFAFHFKDEVVFWFL